MGHNEGRVGVLVSCVLEFLLNHSGCLSDGTMVHSCRCSPSEDRCAAVAGQALFGGEELLGLHGGITSSLVVNGRPLHCLPVDGLPTLEPLLELNLSNLFPERLQIRVVQSHQFDLIGFARAESDFQPFSRLLVFSKLAGVAGKIVTNDPLLRKKDGGWNQKISGLFGAFQFVEGKGAVNPTK